MQNTFLPIAGALVILALALAVGAGALLHARHVRITARQRRRPPEQWPMRPRLITNTLERHVGRWLNSAFADQTLMVKMPITRFTTPDNPDSGLHWYELLGSLYCTYTVVRPDGRVVGCIDLHNQRASAKRSQKMKRELLHQCGFPYLVVEPHSLPDALAVRHAFLGDEAFASDGRHQPAAIAEAITRLQNQLTRRRQSRDSGRAPLSADTDTDSSSIITSSFMTPWQDNSFVAPLDSRVGSL